MKLVEVITAVETKQVPYALQTLYNFRSRGRYPKLVIKVAGKIYVDVDEWQKMCDDAQAEQVRKGEIE